MSQDEFKSLKGLGKKLSRPPTPEMMQAWINTRSKVKSLPSTVRPSQWLQLAAALIAGIIIGKFIWQSGPDFFSERVAKNNIEDETFEYVYTNN